MEQPSAIHSWKKAQMTGQPQNVSVQPVQTQIPGQPVQTQVTDPRQKNKNALYGLGITEVVLGVLSVILAIVSIIIAPGGGSNHDHVGGYRHRHTYYHFGFTYVYPGIWCGIFILVTGALGIILKSNPKKSFYIANMIMAIITATVTLAGVVLSGIAAGTLHISAGLLVVHILICIFHFVAMILTIKHASICCSSVFYNPKAGVTQKVKYIHSPNVTYPTQPQYAQGPNGQLLMVSNLPMQSSVPMTKPTMIQSPAQHYPQATSPPYFAVAPPHYVPNVEDKQVAN